jgi:hypothetical protein
MGEAVAFIRGRTRLFPFSGASGFCRLAVIWRAGQQKYMSKGRMWYDRCQ